MAAGIRRRPGGAAYRDDLTGFVQYHDGRVIVMLIDATRPNFTTGGQWDARIMRSARKEIFGPVPA
ncbi:hypothetical protein GCM10011319_40030 [Mameliella alba]|nr:hypothetical protein GCM10011319_40030 [Mameliella alba]